MTHDPLAPLRRACSHEAGHATAACVLGFDVDLVEVSVGGSGSASIRYGRPPEGAAGMWVINRAVVLLAGAEGERAAGLWVGADAYGDPDRDRLRALLDALRDLDPGAWATLGGSSARVEGVLQAEAASLLKVHRGLFDRLRGELYECHQLCGEELAAIINGSDRPRAAAGG